ncbi:obg family GTPase CgtA [Gigaspora rosea]|uniref:Obg family GTPase CgtA n=1 Tax=Gigaspora rosea TaxID=44941 RepID=A0A397UA15_9GLOM|nr:obg family GTPase CgtA [Gigaspora rosea]
MKSSIRVVDRSIQYKFRDKTRQFVDYMHISVKGGNGGDGCVAFLREKFKSRGPPSGGNGGRGGHIIFIASANHSSLHSVKRQLVGGRGENGKGYMKNGSAGKDIIVPIPLGTVVKEIEPPPSKRKIIINENEINEINEETLIEKRRKATWVHYPRYDEKNPRSTFFHEAERMIEEEYQLRQLQKKNDIENKITLDLSVPNVQYIVAHGGSGGKGNPYFQTNVNRSPKFATRGLEGQHRFFELEIKTIADAGLVGLPNAGKSTFLTAISNARPKIAPYPFTTLNPFIGTLDYADRYQLKVADIPGIIHGAHKNIGLGHSFLRHIERSRVLVYVIDLSGIDPWEDWKVLRNELELYKKRLTEKPSLIVANKADITEKAKRNLPIMLSKAKEFAIENGQVFEIVPVSAKYKENIVKVTSLLRQMVEKVNKVNEKDINE